MYIYIYIYIFIFYTLHICIYIWFTEQNTTGVAPPCIKPMTIGTYQYLSLPKNWVWPLS